MPLNILYSLIPNNTKEICQRIIGQGGRCIFIGGWVRDALIGIHNPNIDIEVYDLPFQTLQQMFPEATARYPKFGILCLGNVDLTLPRKETCTGKRYNDFSITLDPHLNFADAAARRDFTVNAIGWDFCKQTFLDPFNGRKDLKNKQLQPISEHFTEDAYRILRAAQFIARFNFKPTECLLNYAQKMSPESLTFKHITHTFNIINQSPHSANALVFLQKIGWLETISQSVKR